MRFDAFSWHLWLQASTPSFYAFGIVQLQLLTEQGPLGLLSAVKEALDTGTLMNLIPRLPVNAQVRTPHAPAQPTSPHLGANATTFIRVPPTTW